MKNLISQIKCYNTPVYHGCQCESRMKHLNFLRCLYIELENLFRDQYTTLTKNQKLIGTFSCLLTSAEDILCLCKLKHVLCHKCFMCKLFDAHIKMKIILLNGVCVLDLCTQLYLYILLIHFSYVEKFAPGLYLNLLFFSSSCKN